MNQLLVNILIQFKLTKDLSIFTANNVEKVMMNNNSWTQSVNQVLFIILSNNHLIRFLKGKTKIMQNLNSAEY